MGKNEPMENSEKRKFASPVFQWYSISVNTGKTRDPNFGEVSNLKFFCMININKMAAIFQFFHNGRHWYSISVNTGKTGDPNFGRLVIWKFSIWSILTKWQPFFNFFIMAKADIPFLSTLGKPETQTLESFFIQLILTKWQPFFNFFTMANADIPFSLTLGNRRPKLWRDWSFEIFLYDQY